MAVIPTEIPADLTEAYWSKHKGTIAKMAGATGVGDALAKLKTAFGKVDWKVYDTLTESTHATIGKLEEFKKELAAAHGVLEKTEDDFKKNKLIPKESTKVAHDMKAKSELWLTQLNQLIADIDVSAKDTHAFAANPKKFIEAAACTLFAEITGPGADKALKLTKLGPKKDIWEYESTGAAVTAFVRPDARAKGAKELVASTTGKGAALTFLPWNPNGITFIKMNPKTKVFLTGPLSGCNVYVCRADKGDPIVMHANSNESASDKVKNSQAKDMLAVAGITPKDGYTIRERLARFEYDLPAFVYGVNEGGQWEFFYHSLTPGNPYAQKEKAGKLKKWGDK